MASQQRRHSHYTPSTDPKYEYSDSSCLNLGLRRPITWHFTTAEINRPVIGADLLTEHGLMVDVQDKKIINKTTQLSVTGFRRWVQQTSIRMLDSSSTYHHLLAEFPLLTRRIRPPMNYPHGIQHHIETKRPLVASRPPPEKLRISKEEFDYLVKQGICRSSRSPWAASLHLAPKKQIW